MASVFQWEVKCLVTCENAVIGEDKYITFFFFFWQRGHGYAGKPTDSLFGSMVACQPYFSVSLF